MIFVSFASEIHRIYEIYKVFQTYLKGVLKKIFYGVQSQKGPCFVTYTCL